MYNFFEALCTFQVINIQNRYAKDVYSMFFFFLLYFWTQMEQFCMQQSLKGLSYHVLSSFYPEKLLAKPSVSCHRFRKPPGLTFSSAASDARAQPGLRFSKGGTFAFDPCWAFQLRGLGNCQVPILIMHEAASFKDCALFVWHVHAFCTWEKAKHNLEHSNKIK